MITCAGSDSLCGAGSFVLVMDDVTNAKDMMRPTRIIILLVFIAAALLPSGMTFCIKDFLIIYAMEVRNMAFDYKKEYRPPRWTST
jgi:hypothetical protein